MTIVEQYDLLVIGGGTAGLSAVQTALERGDTLGIQSIALIESRVELGGECALNACVPTKVMLTAATQLEQLRQLAPRYGLLNPQVDFDFSCFMQTVDEIVHEGGYDFLNDSRVTRIHGQAKFINDHQLSVNDSVLGAQRIIVATGSVPKVPKIPGLADIGYLTFREATHLKSLPESLVILGSGPVGIEFAYCFKALGVDVTLIEKGESPLSKAEPEIRQAVQQRLEGMGVRVLTGTTVQSAETGKTKARALIVKQGDQTFTLEADEVLSAIGMQPNLAALNAETANIKTNKHGIEVDAYLRSSNRTVYAIGDITGHYNFTHVAGYHAEIAVQNAFSEFQKTVDYSAIGWTIFIEPSVSHVGLLESDALSQCSHVRTVFTKSSTVSRYRIESEPSSFLKLIIDEETHTILGAHCFASSSESIAQLVMVAISNDLTCEDLLNTLYIYPAKTQLLQKALEQYVAEKRAVKAPLTEAPKTNLALQTS